MTVEDAAWGYWRVTQDLKTFRWVDPKSNNPAPDLDIETSVAATDLEAAKRKVQRHVWRVNDNTSSTSEVRILSTLSYAAGAIENNDHIEERYILT